MADSEELQLVLDEIKEAMDKALRSLQAELQKVRTGRANPALLGGVQVDYYGAATPLNRLANVSVPEPQLIVVSPYDASSIGAIERAILSADLGLVPNSDGKLLRIPIPPLTEERRKELVKLVKKAAEEHKIGVRDARRAGMGLLKELPDDERKRAEKKVQELTDAHVKEIDAMLQRKEREILEV